MTYVLLIVVFGASRGVGITAEYNTQARCEEAKKEFVQTFDQRYYAVHAKCSVK